MVFKLFINCQLPASDANFGTQRVVVHVRLLACVHIPFTLPYCCVLKLIPTVLQDSWDLSHDRILCACVNYVIDHMSDVDIHVFKFNIRNFLGHV